MTENTHRWLMMKEILAADAWARANTLG